MSKSPSPPSSADEVAPVPAPATVALATFAPAAAASASVAPASLAPAPVVPAAETQLALRRVAIDTYRENVAYLHRDCAVYRAEGFQALSKVEVRANGRRILATLNVVDDEHIVGILELGLSEDAFAQLDVRDGHPAAVSQAEPPSSIPALHRKIAGERQPIGNGVGPVLEARDVMRVLENDPRAPNDLRQKALRLAGRVIEFDPDVRGGDGFAIARDILDSGRALAKMDAIIRAQGGRGFDHNAPRLARLSFEVCASRAGMVTAIDNQQIARIARAAGAPKGQGAGVELFHKLGDAVVAGACLYRVYADFAADLEFARQARAKASGYTIGRADELPHVFVEF